MRPVTRWALAAALGLLLGAVGTSAAQEAAPDAGDLLLRLERAEAEIRALKAMPRVIIDPTADPPAPLPPPAVVEACEPEGPSYPTFTPYGVIQADAGWYQQSTANREVVGDAPDGIGFRRARLGGFGKVADNVSYRFQMDFAFPGRPTFTDVFIDLHEVPWLGNVRIGQWKQFIGLEEITSFRFNPFLERASIFLFNPFRRPGVGFYDHSADERFTWAASVFASGQDQYGDSLTDVNGYAMASRVTFNPVYEDDGERVLHLGTAYHLSAPLDGRVRFGTFGGNAPEWGLFFGQFGNPDFRQTPSFVDTGVIRSDLYHVFAGEWAVVRGPLSLQAEFNYTLLEQIGVGPVGFWGGYLFATYFLTGEHRVYDRKQAAFERVIPRREWRPLKDGLAFGGAWELAGRLSYIDLTDRNIDGGRLADVTLGLNWYLNRYTRLTFNYIHAFLQRGEPSGTNADVYALRAQVDF